MTDYADGVREERERCSNIVIAHQERLQGNETLAANVVLVVLDEILEQIGEDPTAATEDDDAASE